MAGHPCRSPYFSSFAGGAEDTFAGGAEDTFAGGAEDTFAGGAEDTFASTADGYVSCDDLEISSVRPSTARPRA